MNIHINIAKLLRLNPDDHLETNRKIREMVITDPILKQAGVTLHELKRLVYNKAESLKLATLAALIQYVLKKRWYTKAEIRRFLGGLFEIAPEEMWTLLAQRRVVELWMGVRGAKKRGDDFVIASDPILQAVVVNRLTEERRGNEWLDKQDALGWPDLDPLLIPTWDKDGIGEVTIQETARTLYKANFVDLAEDVALLQIGSVKSCPTIEFTFAHSFHHAKPFFSEDDVEYAEERSCPFQLIYRPDDPRPPSCHAGTRLSRNEPGDGPGIYYETRQVDPATGRRKWVRLPWDERPSDCAMVFYRYIKSPPRVEMVLGGYSGRATRCLADYLRQGGAAQLWPPTFSDGELDIGIFFLRFTFDDSQDAAMTGGLAFPKPIKTETIAMDREVIDRRVRRHRGPSKDKNDNSQEGDAAGQDQ